MRVVSMSVRGARGTSSAPALSPVAGLRVSFRLRFTPSRPAAIAAATARYGLLSAPGARVSRRVDFAPPQSTRKVTVRLSTPQVGFTGAQNPSTKRLYELIVGQNIGANSSMYASWPAR